MSSILNIYPFLHEIPKHDLSLLDLNTLIEPTEEERILISQLSARLNKNIVIYKTNYKVNGGHLCQYLRFAELSLEDLSLLQACEEKLSGRGVVVAYEKPLTFTSS